MESSTVAVVTVPFPAQGHLNQLLHLSLLLASRGLPVHFAAPEPHLGEARARLHGWDGADAAALLLTAVRFRALEFPACASPPPDPASPFPVHMQPLFEAFCEGARAPLAALLRELAARHRRVVVLHDRMAAFAAAEAARLPNGESLGVHCLATSYNVGWADPGHRLLREHGLVFHPPDACATAEFVALAKRMGQERRRAPGAGMVCNTCRALEGEFLDVVAGMPSSDGRKLFAVGPLNPVLRLPDATPAEERPRARHECLDWLDAQPPSSVLYISFGTTSSLREEQVRALAAALRGSNQRFIWALRDADRADMRDAAESRAERLAAAAAELGDATARGVGVVVTGWAPQLEILAHGATAAFMSHGGWNSTVESLSHGKPILAWPMHSDQPWDAELVCKYFRTGVLVRPWEQRYDVTPASAIREAIEKVMASDEGAAMRRRAAALGKAVQDAVADGGSSRRDLDDLVAYMTSLAGRIRGAGGRSPETPRGTASRSSCWRSYACAQPLRGAQEQHQGGFASARSRRRGSGACAQQPRGAAQGRRQGAGSRAASHAEPPRGARLGALTCAHEKSWDLGLIYRSKLLMTLADSAYDVGPTHK